LGERERDDGLIATLVAARREPARARLTGLLEAAGGIEVVGEAATGVQVVVLAHRTRPDVVLIDSTDDRGALEVTPQLLRALNGVGAEVLVLGRFERGHDVLPVWRHGISGVVDMDVSPAELLWAVRMSACGTAFFMPSRS